MLIGSFGKKCNNTDYFYVDACLFNTIVNHPKCGDRSCIDLSSRIDFFVNDFEKGINERHS